MNVSANFSWSQSYDFRIYNYVQRQRCNRLVRFFNVEDFFYFSKRTRLLLALYLVVAGLAPGLFAFKSHTQFAKWHIYSPL
jgi:hypothetical protein